jgi:hypothetical protein
MQFRSLSHVRRIGQDQAGRLYHHALTALLLHDGVLGSRDDDGGACAGRTAPRNACAPSGARTVGALLAARGRCAGCANRPRPLCCITPRAI